MWKNGQKTNNYRFIDKQIRSMYDRGGTGIGIHLYLGPGDSGIEGDATQPQYAEQSITNIQDILFLENRDRKYDPNVYTMRGIYQRSDSDFDLSQFGLFLTNNTIFMTVHLNDMVETLGRKLMNGDVIEFFHLKDDYTLGTVTAALKRFYLESYITTTPKTLYFGVFKSYGNDYILSGKCKVEYLKKGTEYKTNLILLK
jgi:hypothetical protein